MIISPGNLLFATISFSVFMLVLLIFMSFSLVIKNRRDKEKIRWLVKTNALITRTIFFEEEENAGFFIPVNKRMTGLLKNPLFRQTLINELVVTSKNLAGVAGANLAHLYNQLGLEKDTLKKLNHFSWHKRAKAIQELATLQQLEYSPVLYNLTNHKNEYIRMEAQTSFVKFHGFDGLSFLNEITYPISEWHQINLLTELSNIPASNFKGIENWLKSSNDSVIIFALKLSASYHQFQLYDRIVECLKHTNPKVRFQAIKCLKDIYEDNTAWHLMSMYTSEPKSHQLQILAALKEIASGDSISFLEKQLESEDHQIKIAAARALYRCGDEGVNVVEKHPKASHYPLHDIIQQVKMESKK
ncbi:MAG: HEAT repeat domain-containing protein [Sphingobacteriaceae bacterium]|nr:HEAT repeat domain-containing protein [Sphingobacteriaceae bacterium]